MRIWLLFWFQIVMAWFYTVPQIYRILQNKTEGLNLAMYAIFMAYLVLSLSLSVASYREKREVVRKQTVIIFVQWTVFIALILLTGLWKGIAWKTGDSVVTAVIVILSVMTIRWYRGVSDPFSKGFMAVWCKSVPQLWLACTIFLAQSGAGLPAMTLLAGHLTAIPRLGQVVLASRGGWDRPTKGLLIGESANVITWLVVTAVWIFYY